MAAKRNLVQLQDDIKMFPNQYVIAYANGANPDVPPFIALGELHRRKKMQEAEALKQAQEMEGAGTVKDQIEQSFAPQAGIAGLQPQGMPQQMPQGMPQQAPQQPMMQAPMAPQAPVAQMAGGGFIGDYGTDFEGIASLPVPDNMYSEDNFAGGGIVAFDGREGSFVETSPGFSELSSEISGFDENDPNLTPAERMVLQILKRQQERPGIEERRRMAGIPTEFVDTGAKTRADLERRQAELEKEPDFFDRILALQPGRFGSGAIGESSRRFDLERKARLDDVMKLRAAAEDQREAARVAFQEKRFAEGEADMRAADKLELDAATKLIDINYKSALTQQALAGRTAEGDRAAQAYLRAKKAEGDQRPDDVILNEGYINYVREKGAAFQRAQIAGGAAEVNMIDRARNNVDARLKDVKSKEFRELNARMAQDRKNKQAGNPTDLAGEYKKDLYTQELNALQGRGSASTQTQAGSASDPLGIRR